MASIQEEILESFYEELAKLDEIDEEMVNQIREVFSSGKKVKADALVAIFAQESEGDLQ